MKKKILIFLLLLIILIGAVLTYVALNLNSLIAKFKPDLEKTASTILAMPVNFGNLEASVFPQTKIIVKEFKLGGGNNSEAFKLKDLEINVNPLALLQKKLEVTKLTVNSPEITISKTQQGVDISGVPKKQADTKPSAPEGNAKDAPPAASPIAISLNALQIKNAKIRLVNFIKDKELSLSDTNVDASIALEGSRINVSKLIVVGLLLGKANLGVTADSILVDNASSSVDVPELKIKLSGDEIKISANYNLKTSEAKASILSDKINVEKLISDFSDLAPPVVKEFNIKGQVKPAINIRAVGANYNAEGTVTLGQFSADVKQFKITDLGGIINLKADTSKQNVVIPGLELSLNGNKVKIETDTTLTFPDVDVTRLLVTAFAGTLATNGKLQIGTPITFNLQNQVTGMQMESAMNALKPGPAIISGTIDSAKANLSGKLDATFMQALSGTVSYAISNGELKGFNIGEKVLKAVNNISFFSGSLYDRVQGKKELFDVANTVVKKSTGNITINNGSMFTKDVYLQSTAYELTAAGRIGFDASLDLKSTIMFTPDVSAVLLGSVKELKSALDEYGRLNIPLAIQGIAPAIIVIPDIKKVLELGAKAYLRDKATDLLENAIKNKASGSTGGLGGLLGF